MYTVNYKFFAVKAHGSNWKREVGEVEFNVNYIAAAYTLNIAQRDDYEAFVVECSNGTKVACLIEAAYNGDLIAPDAYEHGVDVIPGSAEHYDLFAKLCSALSYNPQQAGNHGRR